MGMVIVLRSPAAKMLHHIKAIICLSRYESNVRFDIWYITPEVDLAVANNVLLQLLCATARSDVCVCV